MLGATLVVEDGFGNRGTAKLAWHGRVWKMMMCALATEVIPYQQFLVVCFGHTTNPSVGQESLLWSCASATPPIPSVGQESLLKMWPDLD